MYLYKIIILFFFVLYGFQTIHADDFSKIKDDIINNYWIKFGSFYITSALSLRNLGYNSNIYFYDELETPDWTTDIGVDLTASTILKNRFIFQIEESPYYTLYVKNKHEQVFNNILKFNLYSYFGHFNIKYSYAELDLYNRPTNEFGKRIRNFNREHTISIDYGNYNHLFVNAYFIDKETIFRDENYLDSYDLKLLLNRDGQRIGLNLYKRIFTQTLFFLNYEYFVDTFKHATKRDLIGWSVSTGLLFPKIGKIKGSFHLGYKNYLPKSPLSSPFKKPNGSGTLDISLTRRINLHFTYLIDSFYSFWKEDTYFDENSYKVGVYYYLKKDLRVGYFHFSGILSFKSVIDGSTLRKDSMHSIDIFSINFRIYKNIGIGIAYTINRHKSNQLGFARSYKFIGGYIIYDF